MKKRIAKKIEKKKFGRIPEGYGIIIGGHLDYHYHQLGTLVKIDKSQYSSNFLGTYDEATGRKQGVRVKDVYINKYN